MSLAADVLDRIVAGRVIASAQLVVGWVSPLDANFQQRLERLGEGLNELLARDYPSVEGELSGSPGVVIFQGAEGHAHLTPTALSIQHEFSGAYTQQWDLAARYIEKQWQPILGLSGQHGVSISELGLLVVLRVSTEGFEGVDPQRLVTRLVCLPLQQELIDAEVRMVFARDDRYLLNVGIGSYRKLELAVNIPLSGQPSSREAAVTDKGLQVKVDVNTRFPLFFKGRTAPVAPGELGRLAELVGKVVETDLRSMMEAVRE